MSRISRGYSVFGLPPGTSLEVRRSMPDIYGSLSSTYVYAAGYAECRLDNLPLTDEQARQLMSMPTAQDCEDLVYVESLRYDHYGYGITATLRISEKAAMRIAGGEPWEAVLFGSAPLRIVPKEGEAW